MKRKIIVMINGYGVPWNILQDDNYERYLTAVSKILKGYDVIGIYLAGGYTNDPCVSEATAMQDWFLAKRPEWRRKLYLIERPVTARHNIEDFCLTINSQTASEDLQVMIFCEHSRRHAMGFIARRLFDKHPVIKGINFDQSSPKILNNIKSSLRYLGVVASFQIPLIYEWQKKARNNKLLVMQEKRMEMYRKKRKSLKLSVEQKERLRIYNQRLGGY